MFNWFTILPLYTQILTTYLLVINIITIFYFGWDKMRSQIYNARRVSEKTLWILSLVGGSIGALIGMKFFRHKTKKLSFQAGIAVILVIQICLVWFLI